MFILQCVLWEKEAVHPGGQKRRETAFRDARWKDRNELNSVIFLTPRH